MSREPTITPRDVADVIRLELEYAQLRFGPMASPHEGIAVVLEEYRELERDVFGNRGRELAALAEAVQLAAMAARYVVDLGGAQAIHLHLHARAFGTVKGAGDE